ncbi:MAG: hypothetical protein ACTHU1_13530 [Arachnia sp.]
MAPSTERPEFVLRMRQAGQPQQSIANTLGVDRKTVQRDLNGANVPLTSPIQTQRGTRPATYSTPATQPATERIDPATGEVLTNYNTGESIAPALTTTF